MTAGRPIRTHTQTFQGYTAVTGAFKNGFNVNKLLNTLDGDEVIVLGIDEGHPFPIVGEVHDYGTGIFGTSWLARWSETGRYRGTLSAALKHSLERNVPDYDWRRSYAKPTVGELLREKLDRDTKVRDPYLPKADKFIKFIRQVDSPGVRAELDYVKAVWEGAATPRGRKAEPEKTDTARDKLRDELSHVYASALVDHSPLEVSAVAYHVEREIAKGWLLFPYGLGDTDFTDLTRIMRVMSNAPGVRIIFHNRKWVKA